MHFLAAIDYTFQYTADYGVSGYHQALHIQPTPMVPKHNYQKASIVFPSFLSFCHLFIQLNILKYTPKAANLFLEK